MCEKLRALVEGEVQDALVGMAIAEILDQMRERQRAKLERFKDTGDWTDE